MSDSSPDKDIPPDTRCHQQHEFSATAPNNKTEHAQSDSAPYQTVKHSADLRCDVTHPPTSKKSLILSAFIYVVSDPFFTFAIGIALGGFLVVDAVETSLDQFISAGFCNIVPASSGN